MATSTAPAPAVQTERLAKRFARTWALRGVSLTVQTGESVCLLGPNGSGKTTLLRLLATAARPSHGDARVFGFDTARDGDDVRRRVGLLSHRTFLYGEMTAAENLRFAAEMYGLDLDGPGLAERLAAVGLADAAGARVRGFSQGMTQRLALARATLHRPSLLFLDEPYNALDAAGLQLLDKYLTEFTAGGGTTILVTHQVEKGLSACQRAVALRGGRVVFDGSPDAFRSSPEMATVGDWA